MWEAMLEYIVRNLSSVMWTDTAQGWGPLSSLVSALLYVRVLYPSSKQRVSAKQWQSGWVGM